MYQGDWRRWLSHSRHGAQTRGAARTADAAGALRRVPGTVWALGITSLLTDISSEMIVSILPAYLLLTAGFAPWLLGVATGLHEGGPLLVTWLGGWAADQTGRRKLTAGAGYALSALCRVGWLAAPPQTAGALATLVLSDRLGKAIRTAPRDALISLSARPREMATAFGVHRALDAAGAAAGPLIAFFLLWQFPQRFDIVFFTAFIVALLGVAALALLVDEAPAQRTADDAAHAQPASVASGSVASARPVTSAAALAPAAAIADGAAPARDRQDASIVTQRATSAAAETRRVWMWGLALIGDPALRPLILLGGAFGLLTIGDAFVYVLVLRQAQAAPQWLPLLYGGTAIMFLIGAVPLGALADRVGRWRVFILGHVPLAAAYLLALAPATPGWASAWPATALLCVMLLGLFYAATDGVLASLASGLLPAPVRAIGLAWVDTAVSAGRLCSALLFGLLWTRAGDRLALTGFTLALICLIAASAIAMRTRDAGGPAPMPPPTPTPPTSSTTGIRTPTTTALLREPPSSSSSVSASSLSLSLSLSSASAPTSTPSQPWSHSPSQSQRRSPTSPPASSTAPGTPRLLKSPRFTS